MNFRKLWAFTTACFFFCGNQAFAQASFKFMHYNVLQFGNTCGNVTTSQKYGWLADILGSQQPDILTLNEVAPSSIYARGIEQISFAYNPAMDFAPFTNEAGSEIVNMLFYNSSLFGFKAVEVIPNSFRDINVFTLYLKPSVVSASDTLWLDVVVAHFKAGDTSPDQNARLSAANSVTNWLAQRPAGRPVVFSGDLNLYGAFEPAFQELVFNTDTSARFFDPAGKQLGWEGATHAAVMTQSPRLSSSDCGSTGGMDDRFDFVLVNRSLQQGQQGLEADFSTYKAVGNHGLSYDQELACLSNGPVTPFVCGRLKLLSDHLPVTMEINYPNASSIRDAEALTGVEMQMQDGSMTLSRTVFPASDWQVEVVDLMGKKLLEGVWPMADNRFEWGQAAVHSGLLVVRVKDATGRSWVRKGVR